MNILKKLAETKPVDNTPIYDDIGEYNPNLKKNKDRNERDRDRESRDHHRRDRERESRDHHRRDRDKDRERKSRFDDQDRSNRGGSKYFDSKDDRENTDNFRSEDKEL